MKVTLLLCDAAQIAEGKLYCLGAGWTQTGPGPATMAVAMLIDVPWDRTNSQIRMSLELREEDGTVVQVPGPAGMVPVRVEAAFEVGRPVGTAAGSAIPVPFAVPIQSLQLAPGRRYYWEATVDDDKHDDWTLHFATRSPPPLPLGTGPTDISMPPT